MHVATFRRTEKHAHLRAFHIYTAPKLGSISRQSYHILRVSSSLNTRVTKISWHWMSQTKVTRESSADVSRRAVHSHLRTRSFISPHTYYTGRTRSTDLVVAQLPRTTGPYSSATPHSRAHTDVQRVATRSACMCVSAGRRWGREDWRGKEGGVSNGDAIDSRPKYLGRRRPASG